MSISGRTPTGSTPDLAIVDPETGARVTRADGAERWAPPQPFAYRSGDLNTEVTEVAAAQTRLYRTTSGPAVWPIIQARMTDTVRRPAVPCGK